MNWKERRADREQSERLKITRKLGRWGREVNAPNRIVEKTK